MYAWVPNEVVNCPCEADINLSQHSITDTAVGHKRHHLQNAMKQKGGSRGSGGRGEGGGGEGRAAGLRVKSQ